MSFLVPAEDAGMFEEDLADRGYVMNLTRLWAHLPDAHAGLMGLLGLTADKLGLSVRDRGVLVTACAAALGDSYCSLAWGAKIEDAAAIRGDDEGLDERERVMAAWARKLARDPNSTTEADVRALREAGFGDSEIFALTLYLALRISFSTVNDALGALPDAALRDSAPPAVLQAVTFGRPIAPDQPL
ncbi:carboxymuconolactone decarboxylase family protein [Nonomuraea sp. NPDC050663]|uniref:carboxymuconolactone decarboxylase family protein n=1 Tax=Nonomuraea sp. NPDC050663 TaxID=3364370 RepID=UPI00379335BA